MLKVKAKATTDRVAIKTVYVCLSNGQWRGDGKLHVWINFLL